MQHNLFSATRSVVLRFFLSIVKVSQKIPHRSRSRSRHARYMFRGDHEKMCTYYLRRFGAAVQRFTRGIILEVGARWWLLCTAKRNLKVLMFIHISFCSQHGLILRHDGFGEAPRVYWWRCCWSLFFSLTLVQTLCVLLYRQIPGWCRCVSAVLE